MSFLFRNDPVAASVAPIVALGLALTQLACPAADGMGDEGQGALGVAGQDATAAPTSQVDAAAASRPPAPAEDHSPLKVLNPKPQTVDEVHGTDARSIVLAAQRALRADDRQALAKLVDPQSRKAATALSAPQLTRLIGREVVGVEERSDSRETVMVARGHGVIVHRANTDDAGWRIDLRLSARWQPVDKGERDPLNKAVSLERSLKGLDGDGPLIATFVTSAGEIRCRLFGDRAPRTVANFVGLARGLRGFYDPAKRAWVKRPFYDGLRFHRIVKGALIQTGDPQATGRGGPGYGIADEVSAGLRHDKAGVLSMASRGPNTQGSQVFITLRPMPELDGVHSVFGQCGPSATISDIASRPTVAGDTPKIPVTLERVTISR